MNGRIKGSNEKFPRDLAITVSNRQSLSSYPVVFLEQWLTSRFLDICRHWSLHKVDTLSHPNRWYLALDFPLPQLVIYNVKNGSSAKPSAFFHFKCSIQSLYCTVKASGSYGETTLDYHLNRYNYYYQQLEVTLIPILHQFYFWREQIIFWNLFSFSWALFTIVTIISCMI